MNRLILIGNGFDLAHGLKTGYNDFIIWYLKKCFKTAQDHGDYDDDLINIKRVGFWTISHGEVQGVESLIDYLYERGGFRTLLFGDTISWHTYQSSSNPFMTKIKNRFFEKLLLNCSVQRWVDIENDYYEALKVTLNNPKVMNHEERAELLSGLNSCLGAIVKQLESYLKSLRPIPKISKYDTIFNSDINHSEIITVQLHNNIDPNDILVLNFNYTNTINGYEFHDYSYGGVKLKVNYIHGKLDDPNNPIVFGFGDELDADYSKMELEKAKGFFEYMKSFWYFKTDNYHNLIRFIEAEDFQVFIVGHSCGLSDRTMLNMIFEHPNCKSIKIFYYDDGKGNNNYTELTQEISRHFKDKAEMRRKIVPFTQSEPMPQLTAEFTNEIEISTSV